VEKLLGVIIVKTNCRAHYLFVVLVQWSVLVMAAQKRLSLIATPLSHYGRKVRILLDSYDLPYSFEDVGNIALISKTPQSIGNNPLMKVPVLKHGEDWIIESDHISSYIVNNFDKNDKYKVNSMNVSDMNIKAMLNGTMTEEVKVIVARRQDVPTDDYAYFGKAQETVHNGLCWLESQHKSFEITNPTYKEFHLVCCWDHLAYYNFVPDMSERFPRLQEVVARLSESDVIARTAPNVLKPKS
jgi:glutathione S-transferase